jgi:YesN/AraC family two-component response regulator
LPSPSTFPVTWSWKLDTRGNSRKFNHTGGLTLSFFADEKVEFLHTVSKNKPLESIVIATAARNLDALPNEEGELFSDLLQHLVNPKDHYVEGPSFYMTPEMLTIVRSIFDIEYKGKARMMFFRSQITVLLSHFFGQLALNKGKENRDRDKEVLNLARDILIQNLDNPPSLSELSKEIGLNTTKLKREFKAIFGVPVFKYLQNERLNKAHKMICKKKLQFRRTCQSGYPDGNSLNI